MNSKKVAVLASGRGSNLQALLEAFPSNHLSTEQAQAEIALVISNKPTAYALERARNAGVQAVYIPWKKGGQLEFETQAQRLLEDSQIDLICLAGFMRLLSSEFTERWTGKMLNIHPSLLPKFKGLEAQKQALEAGERHTGATVHFVDAGLDSGEIVLQDQLEILPEDTVQSLSERLLLLEHALYPKAVRRVLERI